jgi:hypothetical protein
MTTFDKLLISIDRSSLSAALRALFGFICIPLLSFLGLDVHSTLVVTGGLLLQMLSLRIVPVLVRKVLPLSGEANAVWTERRQIAKRYDSFQWQKLFFIGLGMACYMLLSQEILTSTMTVSSCCILFGAIGLARWYTQLPKMRGSIVNKGVL